MRLRYSAEGRPAPPPPPPPTPCIWGIHTDCVSSPTVEWGYFTYCSSPSMSYASQISELACIHLITYYTWDHRFLGVGLV